MELSGTYRLATCDNREKYYGAIFNNALPAEDMAAVMAGDNDCNVDLKIVGEQYSADWKFSKTPQLNSSISFQLGVEFDLPASMPGKMTSTRKGTQFVDTVKMDDGTVFTYVSNFNSNGFSSKLTSSKDGMVVNAFWEKVDGADLSGYYIMTHHENGIKAMESYGVSLADATTMMNWVAVKFSESEDGVITMTDWLGNGGERSMTMRFDEEVEMLDKLTGVDGVHLSTRPAPGVLVYTFKDKKTGKTGVWKGKYNKEGMVWTTEKAHTGVECTFHYRRVGDLLGTWKMVTASGFEALNMALGMPAEKAKEYAAVRYSMTFKVIGSGVYQYSSDNQYPCGDPVAFRDGEEVTHMFEGVPVTEICHITKTGLIGCYKMMGKSASYEFTFNKNFGIYKTEVDGISATAIFARQ